MKKILVILVLIISVKLQAEWRDDWAEAVQKCQNKNYNDAELKFSSCIKEIEFLNDVSEVSCIC